MKKYFLFTFVIYILSFAPNFAQENETFDIRLTYCPSNPTVYFNKNSAELTSKNGESLQQLLAYAQHHSKKNNFNFLLMIYGNSQGLEIERSVKKLSKKRAKVVVKYLVSKGIKKDFLIVKGYGCQRPQIPDDCDNKGRNRYVSCELIKKK